MKQRCIEAVQAAIGRPLRAAEDKKITDDLRIAMRQLQAEDQVKFDGMTENERLIAAADIAAQRLVADAELKQRRVALQAIAHDKIDSLIKTSGHGGIKTLDRIMAFDADQRSGVMSIEAQRRAIRAYGIARLSEAMDENNGAGWKLFSTDAGVIAMVNEAHGQRTGNSAAAKAAQAFRDIAERNRQRFNSAGGNIGHLEDWGVPHSHSQFKIAQAGKGAWVNAIRPLLNRAKYVNPDGSRMTDAEFTAFIESTYDTLPPMAPTRLSLARLAVLA